MADPVAERIAGAPISWGVCEVPGWGWQLDPDTVLTEMAGLGLSATEFGPDGFLPAGVGDRAQLLASKGLRAVGGFVPVVLHRPDHDPVPYVQARLEEFVAAGASTLVLAAATGLNGYDERPQLDDLAWHTVVTNLERLLVLAAGTGVVLALHPHVGTMIDGPADLERVLRDSSVGLCLDTGHLLIGGSDPVALAQEYPDRVVHVHLKDVDTRWVEQVRSGSMGYADAVRSGLYRPLGAGDIDIAAIVRALEAHQYSGWYVLEQDTILSGPPSGDGPVSDVRVSLDFLRLMDGMG